MLPIYTPQPQAVFFILLPSGSDYATLLLDQPTTRRPARAEPIVSLETVGYTSTGKIIGRKLDRDAISWQDTDIMHTHLTRDMSEHDVAVLELDSEHSIRQRLYDRAFKFDRIFFSHKTDFLLSADIKRQLNIIAQPPP
jgi:hypothetical protein